MSCPKCSQAWRRVEGNELVCDNCGLRQIVPTARPTYEQLEKEVENLKETIRRLESRVGNIP